MFAGFISDKDKCECCGHERADHNYQPLPDGTSGFVCPIYGTGLVGQVAEPGVNYQGFTFKNDKDGGPEGDMFVEMTVDCGMGYEW